MKNPLVESFKHNILLQLSYVVKTEKVLNANKAKAWEELLSTIQFIPKDSQVTLIWSRPVKGQLTVSLNEFAWYLQGDNKEAVALQKKQNIVFNSDKVEERNRETMLGVIAEISKLSGFTSNKKNIKKELSLMQLNHFDDEEHLFNAWARNTKVSQIDIVKANEACTAPEMRFISRKLGKLKGKKILDIGCGLGEASVYFASKGASVTALDLSPEMLSATEKLAQRYRVKVKTIQAAVEYLNIPKNQQYDVIYAGNLFHHVDINATLGKLLPHLKRDGILVCWEPVKYNPIINIYRRIARNVRSDDESPLGIEDIHKFRKYFSNVQTHWFWLTTLLIFCYMAIVMRRNPNKIRYWKKVVEEENKWRGIYLPLEQLDMIILRLFPILRYWCWNVVIVCTKPKYLNIEKD